MLLARPGPAANGRSSRLAQASAFPPPLSIHFVHGGNAAELPLELAGNAAFVAARVNHGQPLSWLLDTAWPATSLDPVGAREVGVGSAQPPLIALPGMDVTGFHLLAAPVNQLGAWYGHSVRGVFGVDLLSRLVAEIDYDRRSIELYQPDSFPSVPRAAYLPIRWLEGLPAVHAKLRLAGRTLDGNFILNTAGSAGIVLNEAFLASHRMLPFSGKTVLAPVIDASGETTLPLARGEWLEVGSIRISGPLVAISRDRGIAASAGWIGGEILRKFRLTLDLPANRVSLAPNRNLVFPIEADASGATVVAVGPGFAQFEIRSVLDNSPASEAGFAPGDELLAIDGEPLADLNLDQVRELLSQAGHTLVLTIHRLGRELKLQIRLRNLL